MHRNGFIFMSRRLDIHSLDEAISNILNMHAVFSVLPRQGNCIFKGNQNPRLSRIQNSLEKRLDMINRHYIVLI